MQQDQIINCTTEKCSGTVFQSYGDTQLTGINAHDGVGHYGLVLKQKCKPGFTAQSVEAQQSHQVSFLQKRLSPVKAVVWSMCEGEDWRVY